MGVITYSELKYERKSVTYEYPSWAIMIGWIMAAASITWIPINMTYQLCRLEGSLFQVITICVAGTVPGLGVMAVRNSRTKFKCVCACSCSSLGTENLLQNIRYHCTSERSSGLLKLTHVYGTQFSSKMFLSPLKRRLL